MRLSVALAMAIGVATIAACDPAAKEPVLVRGFVVDESGTGVGNTTVVLDAFDAGGVAGAPAHFSATTSTAPDGAFEFRLVPPDGLRKLAADNRGMIGFGLRAQIRPNVYGRGAFMRGIAGTTWVGEPPTVEVKPEVLTP